jgi:hypothetical protein
MSTVKESVWNVEFTGDYFTLTSTVIADDEEQAVVNATHLLQQHYGLDIDAITNEINTWETAQ